MAFTTAATARIYTQSLIKIVNVWEIIMNRWAGEFRVTNLFFWIDWFIYWNHSKRNGVGKSAACVLARHYDLVLHVDKLTLII